MRRGEDGGRRGREGRGGGRRQILKRNQTSRRSGWRFKDKRQPLPGVWYAAHLQLQNVEESCLLQVAMNYHRRKMQPNHLCLDFHTSKYGIKGFRKTELDSILIKKTQTYINYGCLHITVPVYARASDTSFMVSISLTSKVVAINLDFVSRYLNGFKYC